MTSLLAAPRAGALRGCQEPRILTGPKVSSTAGDDAIELARHAGLHLDPWQQLVLRQSLGEAPDGKWSSFEVGLLVARQNGKGAILEARELAGLFLLGEDLIMHSAHLYKTSVEAWRRVTRLIKNTPDLHRMVKKYPAAHGEEGIELKSGARLMFVARTKGSGRGFSGDCIILDEAYNLDEGAITAMMPTMSARPNPQIWYTSSAGNETSTVLGRIVRRGMIGDDSLSFMDWSVPHDPFDASKNRIDPDDREGWAQANPGLGIRITEQYIERERRSPMGKVGFARERLGVGTYPVEDDEEGPISEAEWKAIADPLSAPSGRIAIGLDMPQDRSRTAIAIAGHRDDGLDHVELIEHRSGTYWVVERLQELIRQHDPAVVMLDPGGPAGVLLADLKEQDVPHELISPRNFAQACGGFREDVKNQRLRHLGDPLLDDSVVVARTKSHGDLEMFTRDVVGDPSPLLSVVLAAWGNKIHNEGPSVYESRDLIVL